MPQLSRRQILVGTRPAGMHGLDEILEELCAQGREPDEPGLGSELVERARLHNFIARPAVDDFAEALVREYRRYAAARACGGRPQQVSYGTWRGYPREQVPWFPTVALDLCDGCGTCIDFCSFGVYGSAPEGRAMVVEPLKCQVGCSSCANVCAPRAITFPPRSMLDAYRPGGR
jgi:CDP-4-dehydro-6-deoxyglucose reductase